MKKVTGKKTRSHKPSSKSSAKKVKAKVAKKSVSASKKTSLKKGNPKGMNAFEQCVVLAAIINQQRNKDKKFLFVPLPDVNSTALAPLRELLGKHSFTANDISKASHEVLASKVFKECFAFNEHIKESFIKPKESSMPDLMRELLALAGPEARKMIYMSDDNPHDIHKTTLEKHALKLGFIEPHMINPEPFQQQNHHKKIIIKLNFHKLGRGFIDHAERFSGKQRRGRG